MPNMYKARLAALGLTQSAILPDVRKLTEMSVNVTELSAALSGVGDQPKHKRIREAVDAILSKLEKEETAWTVVH
ncbi:MAG: hypothetical protein MJ062_05670 [Oscillospiraceae bacterium]|nr:hypothetical protein [Oscillospiraceae bacterium]